MAKRNVDRVRQIIGPIVEGQIREFIRAHPSILDGVNWFKPNRTNDDRNTSLVNSLTKRIVGDLGSATTQKRLKQAMDRPQSESPSFPTQPDPKSLVVSLQGLFSAETLLQRTGTMECRVSLPLCFLNGEPIYFFLRYTDDGMYAFLEDDGGIACGLFTGWDQESKFRRLLSEINATLDTESGIIKSRQYHVNDLAYAVLDFAQLLLRLDILVTI